MTAPARHWPRNAPDIQQRLETRAGFAAAREYTPRWGQCPAGQAKQAIGLRDVVSGRKEFDHAHLPDGFQCTREFGG